MTRYLRQGDTRWRMDRLGFGPSTIGRAGCLLVAITEAASLLGAVSYRDPRILNDYGRAANAFDGSSAFTVKLARCAGLLCEDRVEGGPSKVVTDALAEGRMALLHVDHDSDKPNGDPAADHWILAISVDLDGIHCADPATGEELILDFDMNGVSGWPDRRPFKTLGRRLLSKI